MIGGFPYSARNLFMSAIFPIFVASGVLFAYTLVKQAKLRILLMGFIILAYAYVFGGYLFDYYGRYAFYSGEAWVKSIKDISSLIEQEKGKYDKVVIGTTTFGDFIQYAFYAKVNPQEVQQAWKGRIQELQGPTFQMGNVSFVAGCFVYTKEDYPGNTVWEVYSY